MTNPISPCLHCTRVRDPEACENKNCKTWRQWFAGRWEYTRKLYRAGMDRCQKKRGVPLGGCRYASPHTTEAYLQTDPCDRCKLPKALCNTPCKVRTDWSEVKHELES